MEQRILEQRARAFDHVFDAVVVTDLEGTIIDWNGGAERLYGYPREEAIGQPVGFVHVPNEVEGRTDEILRAVEHDGKWKGEIRMLHRDGTVGWIESVVVPLLDDDGQLIGALGINRDISQRVEDQERLAQLAMTDSLTRLPNRYLFLDRFERLLARAHRFEQPFAVLFIDLDDFKEVNDSGGHLVGDEVLRRVAGRMRLAIRESDTLARIGGDEFAVLVERVANAEAAGEIARKLLLAVDRELVVSGVEYQVSVSIGIATYPEVGEDVDTLMAAADHAMYRAKEAGGKRFEQAVPGARPVD